MPEFDRLIPDARAFFDALAAHNDRDWFAANRPRYETLVKQPAEAMLDRLGGWLDGRTGRVQTPKLYRIHRDLRFSKDKTPYNTHLHLQWSDKATGVCHLFGISRDYVAAGVGAMAFDGPALGRWRDRTAGAAGADFAARLEGLLGDGARLDPPELKRVPAPHPQEHPRADLLRRKGIVLWYDFSEADRGAPVATLEAVFTRFAPFREALGGMLAG